MTITRGTICMARLVSVEGSHVQGGIRPVIVVRNNLGNKYSPTVQVIPLTSKVKKLLPVHTTIEGFGLAKRSTVLTEQIQTIDKINIISIIGIVDKATIKRINLCIMIQLGMEE